MNALRQGLSVSIQSPSSLTAALALAALVPAVGVLGFMSVAMRNERLAVQERLTAVYANHLTSAQQRVAAFGRERQAALQVHAGGAPAATFAAIVRAKLADGVIVTDVSGKVLYPSSEEAAGAGMRGEEGADWARARELEFQKNDWVGAAESYGRIAESSGEATSRARAMQAQAACWLKTGETERALEPLAELAGDASLRHAMSAYGTLVALDAQLLILKTLGRTDSGVTAAVSEQNATRASRPQEVLNALVARLNDYADARLPAGQRRFLMTEVQALAATPNLFPTLAAENLAADYLEHDPAPPATATNTLRLVAASAGERIADHSLALAATGGAKVWRLPSADGAVVALWREDRLRKELATQFDALALPDVRVSLLAPGEAAAPALKMPVPSQDAGDLFPGWRLALSFRDGDPMAEALVRQARFYLWIGGGVVAIIGLLSVMVARYVAAQVRLARIKDELVSTVSHELKTPLASMRALLDTVSAGRYRDAAQMQRYLQLATKENLRLSHLIENFLVFSRLERGRQQFRFTTLAPEEILRMALDALGEKLTTPLCHLITNSAPDLPAIRGDADALSTVLVNLLDNAYKYTNGEKRIAVNIYAEAGQVIFAVADNGIGIAPDEQSRIFDRFYQIDQSLTRQRGGCGLGLSIVQSIVRAHGGSVDLSSAPGQGSTFRVRLPVETLDVQSSAPITSVGAGNRRTET